MAEWQPHPDGLNDLLSLLQQSGQNTTASQDALHRRTEAFKQVEDYPCYLSYIFTQLPNESYQVRSLAGLLLKNAIIDRRTNPQLLPPYVLNYLKSTIFNALADQQQMIRNTAAIVIDSLFVQSLNQEGWLEWIQKLAELAFAEDAPPIQKGAYSCLSHICEDIPQRICTLALPSTNSNTPFKPIDLLIPKFLATLKGTTSATDPTGRVRVHALTCCYQFQVLGENPLMTTHLEMYIQCIFARAMDKELEVRKLLCQSIVGVLATYPESLIPHLNGVVDFMLYQNDLATSKADPSEEEVAVSLEACEFWLTFAEEPQLLEYLRPFVPKVAPALLRGMRYKEADLAALGDDVDGKEDWNVADRAEDIKPQFHSSKRKTLEHEEAPSEEQQNGAQGNAQHKSREKAEGDEEDEYDFDDDDDEDESTEWNLRKCSAAAMDILAVNFEGELLDVLMPDLKAIVFGDDWLAKESGILALGAIAEGCIDAISPYLPEIIPFLLASLRDPKPLVRSISCWTLGRYVSWCVGDAEEKEHFQKYFVPVLEGLMLMVLDNNKRVQEAGCSAFATLEEEAQGELEPFLGPVLQNLVFAFGKYQQKNLLILYDAIGTLADAVGAALNKPELIDMLLPALIERWQKLDDTSLDLIPLLECMSSVVIAIGPGFVAYAQPVFERCVRIIHQSLTAYVTYQQSPGAYELPDKTFLVVALDLLSGLTQGLGPAAVPLYENGDPRLLQMLQLCITYPDPPVRQSGYALVGDCAISCFQQLKPYLPQIMPELIRQIEVQPKPETVSVCNNAAWAAGEIAMKSGEDISPFVPPLLEQLIAVLLVPKPARSLSENSAVTIGRLGLACPQLVAPHLNVFIATWCSALVDIKDNDEKDSAFRGICRTIQLNPNGISSHFGFFLNSVARWTKPSPALNEMFRNILQGFKQLWGDQWTAQMAQMPPHITNRLSDRYGL
ncbi:Transportin-PC [Atractiella rhizophila]|nr:Transportin-PC [Atractiella rhizophila]